MSKSISAEALKKIQATFGKDNIMKLGENIGSNIARRSTGSLSLDHITGGGFPVGRIVEIYGPESSGKTTATIHAIVEEQKAGGVAAFIDAEHAFDKKYAEALGVDVKQLLISQPDCAEDAMDITLALIRTGEVGLVIIDSTNSLVPKAELEGDVGDASMAVAARLLSKSLRMLKGEANRNDCTVVFISQIRASIGPYSHQAIGVGTSMRFYASLRLALKRSQPIMVDGVAVGHTITFETKKNKTFPPFQICETILRYGKGYDRLGEILDLGVQMEILHRKGAWYSYKDSNIGQGKEKTIAMLEDNPDLATELEDLVILGLKNQDNG